MSDESVFSAETDTLYQSWDELLKAEANGFCIISFSERPKSVPMATGPYATKEEAVKARVRLRNKWKRNEAPYKVHCYVRPLWKGNL